MVFRMVERMRYYYHIIRYNAKDPQKHALFPKYEFFRADTDYADIAKFLGLKVIRQKHS